MSLKGNVAASSEACSLTWTPSLSSSLPVACWHHLSSLVLGRRAAQWAVRAGVGEVVHESEVCHVISVPQIPPPALQPFICGCFRTAGVAAASGEAGPRAARKGLCLPGAGHSPGFRPRAAGPGIMFLRVLGKGRENGSGSRLYWVWGRAGLWTACVEGDCV